MLMNLKGGCVNLKSKILRYGIMRRFKRGDSMLLFLDFKCMLNCEYCALKYIDGKYPESNTMGLVDWIRKVRDFPRKIREVKITGGEPTMVKYFPELVKWLLDNGYYVLVLTNLGRYRKIKSSRRLIFMATWHHDMPEKQFMNNLKKYRDDGHRVNVAEIGKERDLQHREYGDTCTGFLYAPDGRLYTHVNELYEDHV